MSQRVAAALGIALVAGAAALVTWAVFSLAGPDLRPTCAGLTRGPECWAGPDRPVITQAGMVPALLVFVTVFAVLAIGTWVSRRPRG